MNTREQTLKLVFQSVAEALSVPESDLTEEAFIREELGADSMDIVTLIILLDDQFDIEFNTDDIPIENVTIRWVTDYICALLQDAKISQ